MARRPYHDRLPEAERLREVSDYDPVGGNLVWRQRPSNRIRIGDVAGFVNTLGYREIRVDGELYLAHRLIWKWFHGINPVGELNHLGQEGRSPKLNHIHLLADVSPRDHRVTTSQANKSSGFPLGVSKCSRYNAYQASIHDLTGRQVHLGVYDTIPEAAAAYRGASKLLSSLS